MAGWKIVHRRRAEKENVLRFFIKNNAIAELTAFAEIKAWFFFAYLLLPFFYERKVEARKIFTLPVPAQSFWHTTN